VQTTPERFWSLVDRRGDAECWPWKGGTKQGYGQIMVARKAKRAHRVAYELTVGPIPEGLTLDHLCRNRACCNPKHLEPVTNRENVLRGVGPSAEAARKTHCPQGHEYTPENVYQRPGKPDRSCLTCRRRWRAERNQRLKAKRAEARAAKTNDHALVRRRGDRND
jgi:hypothetical protein